MQADASHADINLSARKQFFQKFTPDCLQEVGLTPLVPWSDASDRESLCPRSASSLLMFLEVHKILSKALVPCTLVILLTADVNRMYLDQEADVMMNSSSSIEMHISTSMKNTIRTARQ